MTDLLRAGYDAGVQAERERCRELVTHARERTYSDGIVTRAYLSALLVTIRDGGTVEDFEKWMSEAES